MGAPLFLGPETQVRLGEQRWGGWEWIQPERKLGGWTFGGQRGAQATGSGQGGKAGESSVRDRGVSGAGLWGATEGLKASE